MNVKKRLYGLLEKAEDGDRVGKIIDVFLVSLIMLNVAAVILETVAWVHDRYAAELHVFDVFSVAVFTVNYLFARVGLYAESEIQPSSERSIGLRNIRDGFNRSGRYSAILPALRGDARPEGHASDQAYPVASPPQGVPLLRIDPALRRCLSHEENRNFSWSFWPSSSC